MRYAPKRITRLKRNQVFVFGSNMNGNHAGGAARLAEERFGAIPGIGRGLRGQSYAFPTLDQAMSPVYTYGLFIEFYNLLWCARQNPGKEFLMTKVGCGIAGIKPITILAAYAYAVDEWHKYMGDCVPVNILWPKGWHVILYGEPQPKRLPINATAYGGHQED